WGGRLGAGTPHFRTACTGRISGAAVAVRNYTHTRGLPSAARLAEHPTPNTQHPTPNTEHRTPPADH
ncbi:MAG: hypothetical protein ACKPHU_32060, partial [Planctomycetaceae bacterium]